RLRRPAVHFGRLHATDSEQPQILTFAVAAHQVPVALEEEAPRLDLPVGRDSAMDPVIAEAQTLPGEQCVRDRTEALEHLLGPWLVQVDRWSGRKVAAVDVEGEL